MAAFERISCGIPQLDPVFDNIRLGDNVVWQLSSLADFPYFVNPFVKQCVADNRPMIYIRFASHAPLVNEQAGVTIYELNPRDLKHSLLKFAKSLPKKGEVFATYLTV